MEREDGVALLVAIAIVAVMSGLSSALVLWTMMEAQIARGFALGVEGRYAAGAAAERALIDLGAIADWTPVLDGSLRSSFTDGAPTGTRRLADGTVIDLDAIRNLANCGRPSACSESDLVRVTSERPWGPDNPRWQLFAYGPLGNIISPPATSSFYLVVLLADDTAERDGDPSRDARDPAEPGAGIVQLRGEAFGPGGSHRAVSLTVARVIAGAAGPAAVRVVSWRGLG